MNTVFPWLSTHRWRTLAGLTALLTLFLILDEMLPRVVGIYDRWSSWKTEQQRLRDVATWTRDRASITDRRRRLKERYEQLYVNLPKSDQMSVILGVVRQEADSSGITLTHIRPVDRIHFTSYDELPLQLTLTGTFHQIGSFIYRIEQSRYLIKVKQFLMTTPELPPHTLEAELTLSVLILKEETD